MQGKKKYEMALKGNAAAKAQQAYGQHRREEHDKSILLFDGLKTFKTGAHEQIAYLLERSPGKT